MGNIGWKAPSTTVHYNRGGNYHSAQGTENVALLFKLMYIIRSTLYLYICFKISLEFHLAQI